MEKADLGAFLAKGENENYAIALYNATFIKNLFLNET
jgi:hypothetical protein